MVPTVLAIGGSDPCGGAGIQADLKAIAAGGAHGASVVTAITVQNTAGVRATEPVPPPLLAAQLDAVFDDMPVAAVKTGLLGDVDAVAVVASCLRQRRPAHVVCDPVLRAGDGFELLAPAGVARLRAELLPLVTLLTPNVHEAGVLVGFEVRTLADAERAGRAILDLGPAAVLVTGGHLEGQAERGTDVLVARDGTQRWSAGALATGPGRIHGAGCLYAASIAAGLARGLALRTAITAAKAFVTGAIRHALRPGRGASIPDPLLGDRERREVAVDAHAAAPRVGRRR